MRRSSAFGAAGSIVALLVWVYYASFIVLFGAEFTRAYSRQVKGTPTIPEPGAKRTRKAPA